MTWAWTWGRGGTAQGLGGASEGLAHGGGESIGHQPDINIIDIIDTNRIY